MTGVTDDPSDPRLGRGSDDVPVSQHDVYLVLSVAERANGFVRPYRDSYVHVGLQPQHPLRELTLDEKERYDRFGYAMFEPYPESESPVTGKFWTHTELARKPCGARTKMGRALSETYARDPHFYGSTYCVGCSMH